MRSTLPALRTFTLLAATGLALAAGCGGSTPPPATSVAVPAASGSGAPAVATGEPPPAAPVMRSASPELRKYWTFGDHPKVALYADLAGLFHTDLMHALVPTILGLTKGQLTEEQARMLASAIEGVKELAFGTDDEELMILRVDDQAFPVSTFVGLGMSASGAHKIELEGAREAYEMRNGNGVLAVVPGVVLVGTRGAVTKALGLGSAATSWPARLALGPDEYLTWAATIEDDLKGNGTLLVSSERLRFSVHGDMPADVAKSAEREFQGVKTAGAIPGLSGPEGELAARFLQSVELSRSGGHIDAALDLHEPTADQARDLSAVATLAADGVRKYVAAAKSAEARNTVGAIARAYAAWFEREDGKPRRQKRLVSFPPVPKVVPSGTKYQSSPADWKPWDRIKFSMDAPQFYQYEVKAAPNGDSAEIIARGDLDGDGKQSLFRLPVHVDRKAGTFIVAPSIEETDPDE